ncbi:MAG: NusG domain II-containing protein [Oscillospiraceae bacterium]|nr:NusG domain II-containing protein [Oscillospiraceae bacterium]
MMNRKLFNKSDFILAAALLSAALIVFFAFFGDGAEAHIIIGGGTVKTAALDADGFFFVPECPDVVFEIRNGAAAFISSDCPDRVCVRTGFIRHGGQFAACLPNGVVLRIAAKDSRDADTVAY